MLRQRRSGPRRPGPACGPGGPAVRAPGPAREPGARSRARKPCWPRSRERTAQTPARSVRLLRFVPSKGRARVSMPNATKRTRAARFATKRFGFGAVCDKSGRPGVICHDRHAPESRGYADPGPSRSPANVTGECRIQAPVARPSADDDRARFGRRRRGRPQTTTALGFLEARGVADHVVAAVGKIAGRV